MPFSVRPWLVSITAILLGSCWCTPVTAASLEDAFTAPPPSVRPWVYWTWLSSNVTRDSITADLEAMAQAGLGGALILDVEQGTPDGPVTFNSDGWYALMDHAVAEAHRLGLELTMNNGPGYSGSGGPWITKERAMQRVFASELRIEGGKPWTGRLKMGLQTPEYRDIAVLAVQEPAVEKRWQIPDALFKMHLWKGWVDYKGLPAVIPLATPPAESIVPASRVVDLSDRMAADGTLTWEVPAGSWTLMRFGHAFSGGQVIPCPPGAKPSMESDKLSEEATIIHVEAFVDRLLKNLPPQARSAMIATHVDSWEGGGQNWTSAMRREFQARRGYDPVPFLPILTHRVVQDMETTERFLFDLRLTVAELMIQNYAKVFRRLANERGLRWSNEAYTNLGSDMDYADHADEPVAECWTSGGFKDTMKAMSSAAHLHGRAIVGVEAFTSDQRERWQLHPASLRRQAHQMFAAGMNRFIIHRYAHQRFPQVLPGMQMGPWGLHYERTTTWWTWSRPWHDAIARCQFLLRQGTPVVDLLELQPEEPLYRVKTATYPGYTYDAVGGDTFATATVKDGRIIFPSGASYRLLVLPEVPGMSLARLAKIRELIRAGAHVVGPRPTTTLGLSGRPAAQGQLEAMANEVWGDVASTGQRPIGAGSITTGIAPVELLARLGVPADLTADKAIVWQHRALPDRDLYFVANDTDKLLTTTITLRAASSSPELWDPETAQRMPLERWQEQQGLTTCTLTFQPFQSCFILLPRLGPSQDPVTSITRNGQPAAEPDLLVSRGVVLREGSWTVTRRSGQRTTTDIPAVPQPMAVPGPWQLTFPAGRGAPVNATLPTLMPLNQHTDPGVAAFSGDVTYQTTQEVPAEWLANGRRVDLDLGRVEIMAKPIINGQDLGIVWHAPYRADITKALRPGTNQITVVVVTTWVNRLIADAKLPDVPERNAKGTLTSWPAWLLAGDQPPGPRITFCTWNQWKPTEAFQDAGLIGPVRLIPMAAITLR